MNCFYRMSKDTVSKVSLNWGIMWKGESVLFVTLLSNK